MFNRIDPKHLSLTPGIALEPKRESKPSSTRTKRFLKGPIPLNWLGTAAKQSGKALHVGIALWFLSGLKRSRKVALSQSILSLFGVSRYSGYRGLTELEKAGLVSVVRHPGRNPIVTILQPAADQDSSE